MTTVNRKMVTAVGVFVLGSMATVGSAQATGFQATELAGGYQLAAMEAACGADKAKTDDKAKEGKCGEGKCGGDKAKAADKAKEGKCGEGNVVQIRPKTKQPLKKPKKVNVVKASVAKANAAV
jgi:uncharacterized low-complexity protein